MKKTFQPSHKDIERQWHLVDLKGKILGRSATKITQLLMGKHKPQYAPQLDMGDSVVVINAGKVKLSGKKEKQKVYFKHSGYPQGFKEIKFERLKKDNPARIVNLAVRRMLPDNRLRKPRMTRLHICAGKDHNFGDRFKEEKNAK